MATRATAEKGSDESWRLTGDKQMGTAPKTFTVTGPTASLSRTSAAVARTGAAIAGTLATNVPSPTWSFATTPNSPALGLTGSGGSFSGTAPSAASPTAYSIVATATNAVAAAGSPRRRWARSPAAPRAESSVR